MPADNSQTGRQPGQETLVFRLMCDGIASEICGAFGRGVHGVTESAVIGAVESDAFFPGSAGLTWALVFASSDEVL